MSDSVIQFGLTCRTCKVVQTFETDVERDAYAITHAQCDTELFRLLTR